MSLNVETKVKGSILTITVDLSKKQGLSKSGKSNIIASTQGNISISGKDGKETKVGLNVYETVTG